MIRMLVVAIGWFVSSSPAWSADVILVQDRQPRITIHAPERVMAEDDKTPKKTFPTREAETQRQRLRESIRDLAHYLGRLSGATVEIKTGAPAEKSGTVPVLIGELAEKAYGPVGKTFPYKQAFRVVVRPTGLGLYGESDLASSYAIYQVLHELGCRWYLPGELGEVLPPPSATLALPESDRALAPYTIYRGVWYADEAFKRRNRMGGLLLSAGHALEHYLTKQQREAHPEWRAEIKGQPSALRLRWSNPGVARAIADALIAKHEADPQPSYSLSPEDGADFDESADDRALDAKDFDPTFQGVSITDRFMVLCNRIAEQVTAKYPDVLLGVLAYVQYTRPPVREKVHPAIVPQIAPITYSRAHPMSDLKVPGNEALQHVIVGWGKAARMTSMYCYAYFLAETSAPQPMLTKWGSDVPFILANNCKLWQPETLSNFEIMMHALSMANRLAWAPSEKPQDVYREINTRFYGQAATAMTAYWNYIDGVWVGTPEYSGCGFAYLRRWTPERMAEARKLMNAALAAAQSPTEKARVQLADESLQQFERFIALRRDLAEGRWQNLTRDGDAWLQRQLDLGAKYKDNSCFTQVGWTKHTVSGTYFRAFYKETYDDAQRIATEFVPLVPEPLRKFRYQAVKTAEQPDLAPAQPDADDSAWKTTDVSVETWSSLGHHDWFQSMWYRTAVEIKDVPAGKRVYLWLGATDGGARVFVNGKPVSFLDPKSKQPSERFEGYCKPVSFDVTDAVRPGRNQIAILATRTFFNELGTGGLLAPVTLYREK